MIILSIITVKMKMVHLQNKNKTKSKSENSADEEEDFDILNDNEEKQSQLDTKGENEKNRNKNKQNAKKIEITEMQLGDNQNNNCEHLEFNISKVTKTEKNVYCNGDHENIKKIFVKHYKCVCKSCQKFILCKKCHDLHVSDIPPPKKKRKISTM